MNKLKLVIPLTLLVSMILINTPQSISIKTNVKAPSFDISLDTKQRVEVKEKKDVGVCNINGNDIKAYEDYTCITNTQTLNYQLLNSSESYSDAYGCRRYGEYYCVALGSYYGDIGSKYKITFSSGTSIKVIKSDGKADIHTTNGCYNFNGSILEIINDKYSTPDYILSSGNYDNHPLMKGNIIKVEEINE